ncbi:MAG: class I tRNA ligase family protein, partial [Eubacterium sp.]|nr:class I tRNA ligase family protein [Eubacterium sp.]
MMALINKIYEKGSVTKAELKTLTILLNPFAPHVTEEMWDVMGFGGMVNEAQWPAYDEAKTVENSVEIVLQIMGKVRSRITIPVDMPKDEVLALAKADEKIAAAIEGKTIKKEIYVPGKLVNIVAM